MGIEAVSEVTENLVKITNDYIVVIQPGISASDYVAIGALLFTIVSSIVTLYWQRKLRIEDKKEQNKIRKEDKKEQDKIRKLNMEEQKENRRKDDALRNWNAIYPHRLRLYTDFYDVLFRFVNYKGSPKDALCNSGTQTKTEVIIRAQDISDFCSLFNKFDEEAKVLFDGNIQSNLHEIYVRVKSFIDSPFDGCNKDIMGYAPTMELQTGQNAIGIKIRDELIKLQEGLMDIKLSQELRKNFAEQLNSQSFLKKSCRGELVYE